MASRFNNAPRNNLFAEFDAPQTRTKSTSPRPGGYGYGYSPSPSSAYPERSSSARDQLFAGANGHANGSASKFRSATPNKKGQYSDAVLNELEGQNEHQFEGMSAKVQMLKQLTSAIGDEIRDSTALAEKMNDQFSNTRVRLQGTMNRMLRMAEKTGVGWRVWVGFFAAVIILFWYVRLS